MAVSREPEFRTTRMREGYDLDAVDDFVDLVIDALEGRSAGRGVTPEQIENEEFKIVRMREGYVMDDVDDWLDAAAAELRQLRKAAQARTQSYAGQQAPGARHSGPIGAAPAGPPVGAPAGPPVGAPVGPPVAPPPAPAGPPTAVYPAPVAPAQTDQVFPPYYDTDPRGASSAYGTQSAPTTPPGYDPLTDSAVNELDPVLRALDPTYKDERYGAPAAVQTPAREPEEQPLGPSTTPSTGLHHIEIWVRDLDAATRSFGWLFERLGWTLFQAWENGRSWQAPGGGPYVVIECSPDLSWVAYDRKAPGLNHLALAVPEQWMVDRIVSEAPAYGWRLMFADRHPHAGGPHHYAAYMENDEGYEVEVVAP